MKLRIESDGLGATTRVLAGDEVIQGVQRVEWSVDASGRSQCKLTVRDVAATIDAIEIELTEKLR